MTVHELEGGWDSRARIVDGRWLERRPRRPEVEARLVQETRLLPWLAPQLPARVPVPVMVTRHPLVVRHELVPGEPAAALTAAQAAACGRFLAALHTVDVDGAVAHGTTDAGPAHDEHLAVLDRFRADVLPRLTPTERPPAPRCSTGSRPRRPGPRWSTPTSDPSTSWSTVTR